MDSNISIELVTWAMDRALASHSVARLNTANASVKGYAPMSISFQDEIDQAEKLLSELQSDNISVDSFKKSIDEMMTENTTRHEDETVQLDAEVRQMLKTSGYYKSLADVLSRKMGLMKLSVTGRG